MFKFSITQVAIGTPHSLGKLIEWKLQLLPRRARSHIAPHSLGKLIEWKLAAQRNPISTKKPGFLTRDTILKRLKN